MRYSPVLLTLMALLVLPACAHDPYRQDADAIKTHTAAFYEHLEAGRVTSAIIENERIEALATQLGQKVLQRTRQPGDNEVDRDWMILTAAREAAAENWLSLARYFVRTKRFEEARGTYQRILATYSDRPFHRYSEQARIGLQDLDLILDTHRKERTG